MSDETNRSLFGGESRRDFMKKGAVATGAAVLGASGTAAAQEGEDDGDVFSNDEEMNCVFWQDQFRPNADFIVTSPVLEWTPNVPQNLGGIFSDFNTRMIRYRNTGENVQMFVAQDAQLPNFNQQAGYVVDDDQTFGENEFTQPEVYTTWNEASFFEGTNRLVRAKFSPVEEDYENQIFEEEGFDENGWIF